MGGWEPVVSFGQHGFKEAVVIENEDVDTDTDSGYGRDRLLLLVVAQAVRRLFGQLGTSSFLRPTRLQRELKVRRRLRHPDPLE